MAVSEAIDILIAFEQSGVTRRAFERFMGNNYEGPWVVVSCDLLPSEDNSLNHIVDDAVNVIGSQHWRFILAHPPCTAIAVSGNAWYGRGMPKNAERLEAVEWTTNLWNLIQAHSDHGIMENPVGILPFKPSQYIQPWEHGHPESKKTGLWLHNLPLLEESNNVKDKFDTLPKSQQQRLHYLAPSKDRWKLRSKTFEGIGEAIATQYGKVLID
jgi:hypothetical protein